MNTMTSLAAIHFDTGQIDALLERIAKTLAERGLRVCGALQTRGAAGGDCHCADMDLTTIGSQHMFRISQPLGNGSRGCRLNPGALAQCAAFLEGELRQGADLLILNRFGRGESEGRGFRDLICAALEMDVPVLTAVRPTYAEAWAEFGGGMACSLPMSEDAVLAWIGASDVRRVA